MKTRILFCTTLALAACKSSGDADAPSEVYATGEISFYADSLAGNKTASGEPYDPSDDTCAHPKLPFGTKLRIDLKGSEDSATCVVNDRGPYAKDRILDVSKAVAKQLNMVDRGAAQADLTILEKPEPKKKKKSGY